MQRQEEIFMVAASIAAKIAARRAWITLCALGLVLGLAACQKLDEPRYEPLVEETIQAIPSSFGEFVAATPHGRYPYITMLWFERPDKTIVGMGVNLAHDMIIREPVVTVRRD